MNHRYESPEADTEEALGILADLALELGPPSSEERKAASLSLERLVNTLADHLKPLQPRLSLVRIEADPTLGSTRWRLLSAGRSRIVICLDDGQTPRGWPGLSLLDGRERSKSKLGPVSVELEFDGLRGQHRGSGKGALTVLAAGIRDMLRKQEEQV